MVQLDVAAAAACVHLGAPVLFIDTCSFLDVPRLVERARKPGPEIDAAQRVLAAARGEPAQVALVVAEIVLAEWAANMPTVRDGLTAHVAKVEEDAARIAACARALGLANVAETKLNDLVCLMG